MRNRKLCTLILILIMLLSTASSLAATPVQTEGITVPVIDQMKEFELPDNEALAFVRDMKCGWNLGNTFDAHPNGNNAHIPGTDMETYWCHAKTTKELIEAIKEAGFNTIRIPVSWHNHVDENDMIDREWIDRVKEVAGWALELGMYAIVNVHHDNNTQFLYPDSAHYERSATYLKSIWSQMAEAFADCDEHLIMESMNEPRLVDNAQYEWYFSEAAPETIDAAKCINRLNQLFVDTVRETGGNNATRYLMVPAYDASPSAACSELFQLPADTVDNRIIVEVHAYTPYSFAGDMSNSNKTFDLETDRDIKSAIGQQLNELYSTFIVKGIPVVIDEFGALDKGGNIQDRVNFAAYFAVSASARGMTAVWWDNNVFSGQGERFGLIDRNTVQWIYPDIALAIQANCLFNRQEK